MTLTECYRILMVEQGATLETIKTSYRRLAFKLHPDLNPDDPEASRKFQRLNEAYVVLTRSAEQGAGPGGPASGARARRRQRPSEPAGNARQADEAYAREAARDVFEKKRQAETRSETRTEFSAGSARFEFRQEEVLRDILRDPFARKVFEDIYAQVRKGTGQPPKKLQRRALELAWGGRKVTLDLSQGIFGGIKSWFRGQLDDEHTAYLPPGSLLPGRTVRLKVRLGLSGEEKQIEVRLPVDFVPGKPIRLKELGRHLGPFKGDLYLRLLPK
ncbi:heat shock protein DnaJ domain protein [Desulfovibrio sp. X2]|uniref:J domain-containing protein n=1 Tax=Desulfovibrio sp. X2 TaxID=941449 RepID=UPI0003586E94|nr:J domain-containing protein [Desulfovibrio sp. X2]EPR37463.1 heat shock protein DnaJ domain protein [Desulfovibrio sp. X2]